MSFFVRDGRFDVVVAAGPGVESWPSVGVRALSALCAKMGLTVGVFGGENLQVKGMLPLPGTGALVLAEDVQKRIHRLRARAVVRVVPSWSLPDPFPGWRSNGLIPISTASRLWKESSVSWSPSTVILGTGNRALRFGSELLDSGVEEVYCVEAHAQWGAKRFAGWEVEKRRFEMAGGRVVEARPVSLAQNGALRWQLRLQDDLGIRILEVARVVSAGPFRDLPGVREHPPGSFFFELDQTALATKAEDAEGWVLEEERGKWLAAKIVRSLVTDLGPRREELDSIYRRARGRLRRYLGHREIPFTPGYQGKWIAPGEARNIRSFSGVPQKAQLTGPTAAIECFETIPCDLCQQSCPTQAITIGKVPRKDPILLEDRCTGCGLCLEACPSGSTLMIEEKEGRSTSQLTLTWRGSRRLSVGDSAVLVNRRGDSLGSGRILEAKGPADGASSGVQIVKVEVPSHLAWEARSFKRPRDPAAEDPTYLASLSVTFEEKVEVTLDGEKRLVRDGIPISLALFETGRNRPADSLFCADGSCGLCMVTVDGVRKLGCQTQIHRGMVIRLDTSSRAPEGTDSELCPCLGVTSEHVIERMEQGKLRSPEAVQSVTHVGAGKCHGRLCQEPFRRLLLDQKLEASQWIDWSFPWSDWILARS